MTGGIALRTQLLLVVAFVELFAIGMGLSYLLQSQAQERRALAGALIFLAGPTWTWNWQDDCRN